LQAGVEIQQDDDDDEELERERVVRLRLMRFVERVRLRELPFVVLELGLLFFGQDRVVVWWLRGAACNHPRSISLWDPGSDSASETAGHSSGDETLEVKFCGLYFFFSVIGEIVVIYQFRETEFLSFFPGLAVVMRDIDHVIGVDGTEGRQAVTNDCEEGYHDVVDDVNNVVLLRTQRYPADEEEHPCRTEERN
jgi:hypothetical protein